MTLDDLVTCSRGELAELLMSGERVSSAELAAGGAWAGTALALPRWAERVAWRKFAKVFWSTAEGVRGENLAVEQNGLRQPWRPRLRRGRLHTYGPFWARDTDAGLVIDYRGPAGPLSPWRFVRDPLVRVGPRLYLGVSDLCSRRLALALRTPTWFALTPGEGPLGAYRAGKRAQ